MDTKIYAAYGSNMNNRQMAVRCPGAIAIGKGVIEGYRLTFRRGGFANIEPAAKERVPVVLWRTNDQHEWALDRYEGFPRFYIKKNIEVDTYPAGEPVKAYVYVMADEMRGEYTVPSAHYFTGVWQGCRDHGLDCSHLDAALARVYDDSKEEDFYEHK